MTDQTINYPKVGRCYKHYKGGTYRVLFIANHTETAEILVICKSLEYGTYYARPLSVWFENVNPSKGEYAKVIYRFILIEEKK